LIISCGQNVQNPEYSRNSGSNSNNTRPGSANNIGQKTANIDNNRGNAVTTSTSISPALTPKQPQATGSNSPNLGGIISTAATVIQGIAKNNNNKPTSTPNYGSAFNSTSPVFTDSSSFYSSSSSSFPDYSSAFSSTSPVFTNSSSFYSSPSSSFPDYSSAFNSTSPVFTDSSSFYSSPTSSYPDYSSAFSAPK